MKLLYFTDTHFRSTNPPVRRDNFALTMKAKLGEIVSLANEFEVEAVLHGGDLFDIPCPSLPEAAEFLVTLADLRSPLYIIAGNHDVFAHDPGTLEWTMLGFLVRLGHMHLLSSTSPVYLDNGQCRIQITGTHFHHDIDHRDPRLDYCVKKGDCDFAVHLAHGMLLDLPLKTGPPHTLITDIAPFTQADITLGSHAHFGYPDICIDGKLFVNPGSVARMSAHPIDLTRKPQVVVLDCSPPVIKVHRVPLSTAPDGREVIDAGWPLTTQCENDLVQGWPPAEVLKPDTLDRFLECQANKKHLPPTILKEARRLLKIARQEEVSF